MFKRNLYLGLSIVLVLAIYWVAYNESHSFLSSGTLKLFIFNPFWAPFIVVFEKFIHEKLQVDYDDLKTKIDKIKGLFVFGKKEISIDSLRLIISGKDENVNAIKAKACMDRLIEDGDPIKSSGKTDLKL